MSHDTFQHFKLHLEITLDNVMFQLMSSTHLILPWLARSVVLLVLALTDGC